MDLKIGCRGFAAPKEKYFKELSLVEFDGIYEGIPGTDTLKDWMSGMPEGFHFTLLAPAGISDWRGKDPGGAAGIWQATRHIAYVLGAGAVVFRSPDTFDRSGENIRSMEKFFSGIDRKGVNIVWEAPRTWGKDDIFSICRDNGLVPSVDPFRGVIPRGAIRYLNMPGMDGEGSRYKGLDLKRLRDLLENETERSGDIPTYIVFANRDRFDDAMRFRWIVNNTGRIREIDDRMLQALCVEIDTREEDEKVQSLSREAERIVSLILFTEYKKVDIEIESRKLREMCRDMFPEKEYLYDMIYGGRFERLWEQFREEEGKGFE